MKTLTLIFSFGLLMPLLLSAQSAGDLLQRVSGALSAGKEEYAVNLFRQAVASGVGRAEVYYWTQVDKSHKVSSRLAGELAVYYKKVRNADKAYLFYRELLQKSPDDLNALVACAEMQLARGKDKEALRLYEKVLSLDADNLQANIFLGNYYFLQAERQRQKLEDEYRKLASPTRMQYARYRNNLSDIFSEGYLRARTYLQRVVRSFHSVEVSNTLEKIKRVEKEVSK